MGKRKVELWSERIPYLKALKDFYSKMEYKGVNLWPVMAGECYKYVIPQKEDWKYRVLMITKFLFAKDNYKIKDDREKILVTYFMPRKDHHELVLKSIKSFPKKDILMLDAYEYKKADPLLRFKLDVPNVVDLFFLWNKFRKADIKNILGKNYLYLIAKTYFRFKEIERFHSLIKKIKPKAYISFNSSAFGEEAIITLICRNKKIPTFMLQHGFLSNFSSNFTSFIIQSENIISDYLLLWGESSKDIQEKYVDKSKLLVLGNPKYSVKDIKKTKGFNPKEATFFFSVTGHEETNKEALKILNKFSMSNPKIKFNLKLHPFDSVDNYKNIVTSKNMFFVDKEYSTKKILEKSDFIIVHSTSIANESLLYRIPIFRFKGKNYANLWKYKDTFKSLKEFEALYLKFKNKSFLKKTLDFYDKKLRGVFHFPKNKTVSKEYKDKISLIMKEWNKKT